MGNQAKQLIGLGPRHLPLPQPLIRSEPGGGRRPGAAVCPDQRARLRAGFSAFCGCQGLLCPETGGGVAEGQAWACPCRFPWDQILRADLGRACLRQSPCRLLPAQSRARVPAGASMMTALAVLGNQGHPEPTPKGRLVLGLLLARPWAGLCHGLCPCIPVDSLSPWEWRTCPVTTRHRGHRGGLGIGGAGTAARLHLALPGGRWIRIPRGWDI